MQNPEPIMETQLLDLLMLSRLFQQRPGRYRALLKEYEHPAAIMADVGAIMHTGGRLFENKRLKRQAEADLQWAQGPSCQLVDFFSPLYPYRLKETFDPPPVLYAKGCTQALAEEGPPIAMVGARKASRYGINQALYLAEGLARLGIPIVSGMAVGIDGAAHKGCLKGGGRTLAVLGTGPDLTYPKRHAQLAERITEEGGLLVSEFPPGTPPYPANFPKRNRIITGMTMATIVVEAALKSGSLVSARLALAEGRDVLVVPGLVTNPTARGCHQLIREGAALIEGIEDILQALQIDSAPAPSSTPPSTDQALLDLLAIEPRTLDDLLEATGRPLTDLLATLTDLEIEGTIESDAGRYHLIAAPR